MPQMSVAPTTAPAAGAQNGRCARQSRNKRGAERSQRGGTLTTPIGAARYKHSVRGRRNVTRCEDRLIGTNEPRVCRVKGGIVVPSNIRAVDLRVVHVNKPRQGPGVRYGSSVVKLAPISVKRVKWARLGRRKRFVDAQGFDGGQPCDHDRACWERRWRCWRCRWAWVWIVSQAKPGLPETRSGPQHRLIHHSRLSNVLPNTRRARRHYTHLARSPHRERGVTHPGRQWQLYLASLNVEVPQLVGVCSIGGTARTSRLSLNEWYLVPFVAVEQSMLVPVSAALATVGCCLRKMAAPKLFDSALLPTESMSGSLQLRGFAAHVLGALGRSDRLDATVAPGRERLWFWWW